MNRPIHTSTPHAAEAAFERDSEFIYRNRFAHRRAGRAYPSAVDADELLRNRRLDAGSLLTYRE